MRYNLTTYTDYSHDFLLKVLNSTNAKYQFHVFRNDEIYSKFEVHSELEVYNRIKDIIENGNGTAISIEYGA